MTYVLSKKQMIERMENASRDYQKCYNCLNKTNETVIIDCLNQCIEDISYPKFHSALVLVIVVLMLLFSSIFGLVINRQRRRRVQLVNHV